MTPYTEDKAPEKPVYTQVDATSAKTTQNCHCNEEINTDGSGQLSRYLKALDPSYAPIDDRSIEELLVFARRYADQIRFYDIPESKIEDGVPPNKVTWKEFFRRDMAVIAASISIIDAEEIKKSYEEIRSRTETHPTSENFSDLFDPILGMAARIDGWYSIALPGNSLRGDLELGIISNLKWEMKKIIDNEEGYRIFVDPKRPLKFDYTAIQNKELWGIGDPPEPDDTVFTGVNHDDKTQHAILYVDDIFNQFYGFLKQIIGNSGKYLDYALEQYPAHQPHMALYIAFIKLFKLAQEQMNGITQRMLDFYYRDVLRLTTKPSIPDKAHIVFELAKGIAEFDVAQGTSLTAGKDASGKDQVYRTTTDIVVNQAKIKELKTIFIEKIPVDTTEENKTIDAIYARPVADSLDGFGAKFTDPAPKWPTFGLGNPDPNRRKNICDRLNDIKKTTAHNDEAEVGFAIASPQLLMQGGKRLVTITDAAFTNFLGAIVAAQNANNKYIEFWLTGEKGWLKVDQLMSAANKAAFTAYLGIGLFNRDTDNLGSSYYIDAASGSLSVYLPIAEKSIIGYDPKIHTGYNFSTTLPVLRMMIIPKYGIKAVDYSGFSFKNISISVKVGSINPTDHDLSQWADDNPGKEAPDLTENFDGLRHVVLQNDNGLIPEGKPFDPFTAYPQKGKSLYIGSGEVFNKPLGKLAVDISHTEARNVFQKGEGFNNVGIQERDYGVSVLTNKSWLELVTDGNNGFNGTNEFLESDLTFNILNKYQFQQGTDDNSVPVSLDRKPVLPVTVYRQQTEKGFIRLDNLRSVSGNANFSNLQRSQDMAAGLEIKEISVSYDSTLSALEEGIDQFFHVYPFGAIETKTTDFVSSNLLRQGSANLLVNAKGLLLPQFTYESPYASAFASPAETTAGTTGTMQQYDSNGKLLLNTANRKNEDILRLVKEANGVYTRTGGNNQYSGLYQEEGMLFIGIENLKPLQSISLLFQFAEGSAANEDDDTPPIHWSYLTNNEWRPLRGENIVSDDTYGFQTTGIVNISIPGDATTNNTIITEGLIWLCASVTEYSDRIPYLVNIVANAVIAEFNDQNNDQRHFDKVLAAGSISKLSVPAAEINKVQQPFASFDGKHQEVGKEFYTRVSERLRHKGRAITAWDYEHLVLDRFPSIYKVKAITHTDPNCICRDADVNLVTDGETCCGPQIAPGHVLVVPISDLKNRNAVNPLQPKTSRRTLVAIEEYLRKRTSPFVHVHAKNPVYEQIIVAFRVKFYTGTDKGFYLKKLNEEIVHYLTPWAFDDSAEVKFGQKVYASAIINFIEKRPYVDFITDFIMGVCRNECCPDIESADNGKDDEDVLSTIRNCNDIEYLLEDIVDYPGDIIARPSTPRSILVSVPQHIIVPYEAPLKKSPCETKATRTAANEIIEMRQREPVIEMKQAENKILTQDATKELTPLDTRKQQAQTETKILTQDATKELTPAETKKQQAQTETKILTQDATKELTPAETRKQQAQTDTKIQAEKTKEQAAEVKILTQDATKVLPAENKIVAETDEVIKARVLTPKEEIKKTDEKPPVRIVPKATPPEPAKTDKTKKIEVTDAKSKIALKSKITPAKGGKK